MAAGLELKASEVTPPASCPDCGVPVLDVDGPVRGVLPLEAVERGGRYRVTRVRLEPGVYRLWGRVSNSTQGRREAVLSVGTACGDPCPDGWWRCPADGGCIRAAIESPGETGVEYCVRCLGKALEECACENGQCQVAGTDSECATAAAAVRRAILDPSVRGCQVDEDCTVVGGAATCVETEVAGAPGGEGIRRDALEALEAPLAMLESKACAAWHVRSAGISAPSSARCRDGACVVDPDRCIRGEEQP